MLYVRGCINMEMRGSLNGGITFDGGGVGDVLTKTSGDYVSVVNQTDNKAYIDLSGYAKTSDLSNYVTNDGLTLILSNYVTSTTLSTVLSDYVTDSELSTELTSYQPLLTAGDNITIENNVISASGGGGGVNYSTTEQDTGEIWIDGTSHVYQKSFVYTLTGTNGQIDLLGFNISKAWIKDGFYDIGATCLSLNEFMGGNAYCYTHINQGLNPPYIDCLNTISANSTVNITIKYIKSI